MELCWCNYGKIPVLKLQWSYLGSETPCAARSPKCPQYIQASRDRPLDLSSIASFTKCPTHPLIKSPVFLCLRALGDERVEIKAEPSGFPAGAQWQKIKNKKNNQPSEFKDKLKRQDKNERAVMRLDEVPRLKWWRAVEGMVRRWVLEEKKRGNHRSIPPSFG